MKKEYGRTERRRVSLIKPILILIYFNSQFPALKWAQRKDKVVITVDVPDIEKHEIAINDEGKLILS